MFLRANANGKDSNHVSLNSNKQAGCIEHSFNETADNYENKKENKPFCCYQMSGKTFTFIPLTQLEAKLYMMGPEERQDTVLHFLTSIVLSGRNSAIISLTKVS